MILRDSFKNYKDQAIGKAIAPEKTCEIVLKKIKNLTPPILAQYLEVQTPLRSPQVRVLGTEDYQKLTMSIGQNGKGHSKAQALASGLMEFIERYSCSKYLQNNVSLESSFAKVQLRNNLFCLKDILKYPHLSDPESVKELETAKISWYQGYTLEGEKAYLPMNLIRYLLESTNGMAAGNSLEEALLHGICEVLERHFLALIESEQIKTPFIDKTTINLPAAEDLIKKVDALGQKVYIKDFSLGLGMPIIAAIRKIDEDYCVITAGAATDRYEALMRALTENSQVEGNRDVVRKTPSVKFHFRHDKTISMEDIPNISDPNMFLEIKRIKELLDKQPMRVFFIIATDKTLNIPCVYVYIPQCRLFHKRTRYRNLWAGLILESLITKNYGGAAKYISIACKKDRPNQAIYWFYQGIYLRRQSRFDEAISYFLNTGKALSRTKYLEPAEKAEIRSFCIVNLAYCYQMRGNIQSAVESLINLYDWNPDFSCKQIYNYFSVGLSHREQQLFKKTQDLYQEIRALRKKMPRKSKAEFKKIFFQYLAGKEKALFIIQKAEILFKNKQYSGAISEINKSSALNDIFRRFHNIPHFLGRAYMGIGEFSKAIIELKKAEKIDPSDPLINISLARCLKKNVEIKLSKEELHKALLKSRKPFIRTQFYVKHKHLRRLFLIFR
ncbi:MAG: YcaO-like family protein [Candidatus Omnitrophica bacterium]|nr:YcaO-like family protein [Candidatus Omnitrophota bacterium]